MNVQTLMRMTSDAPECITRHLNVFFAQGGDGYVRSGGPGNRDMELTAWIREAAGNIRAEIYAEDNECLCDELYDNLMYGIEEPEGVVAYLYLAALQAIEMRGRLKKIEDILGDTYDLDRLRELAKADGEGRCVVIPCHIGDPVFVGTGLMKITGYEEDVCDGFYIARDGILQVKARCWTGNHSTYGVIGETMELTREAAEKALEEMEENDNG